MNTAAPEKSVPKKACALFCLTAGGIALAHRLRSYLEMDCFTSPELVETGFIAFDDTFSNTVRKAFIQYDSLVMIG
ncbi:cobalamin biosynthesis protein CbiG, partial [Xenorhabdus bovienii]|nr:cobalamin biosynthesis protein CbiG [Xenorhabdus bovienii]